MKIQNTLKYIIVLFCVLSTACIEAEQIQERPQRPEAPVQPERSQEMQNLIDFLETDTTNEQIYSPDYQRGVDYYVCAGFCRDLASNASEYGIKMGGISLRDTLGVGVGTRYYHAMNYCIVDERFIVIEPQTNEVFTLDTLKHHHDGVYNYVTIFPNANMMTNFGNHKETINIYLREDYIESKIIEKFPLCPT